MDPQIKNKWNIHVNREGGTGGGEMCTCVCRILYKSYMQVYLDLASCGQFFGGHSSQVVVPKTCKLRFLFSDIEDCLNIFLTHCII